MMAATRGRGVCVISARATTPSPHSGVVVCALESVYIALAHLSTRFQCTPVSVKESEKCESVLFSIRTAASATALRKHEALAVA